MTETLFFYDLETSGVNPKTARIMQFAGQRTDKDLNLIGEPVNYLIKMSDDVLPDPEAILVTGITPQKTIAEGITEEEFLRIFHQKISIPGTTFTGFNSVRFDDEFIRYLNWRNYYDPYSWHWEDGRSRWDLLDTVRMTRALRPKGINWPVDSEGKATNRLELLASVNKLEHTSAHDALSDVLATIGLARVIKEKVPKLFDYLYKLRQKNEIRKIVDSSEPFVYTSGKYPSEHEKTTVVAKLLDHPSRKDSVLVYDLRHDPKQFKNMTVKELVDRWKWDPDREEPKLPIKTLKFNRCPAVAPVSVLDNESTKRLGLDKQDIQKNLTTLLSLGDDFKDKIIEAIKSMEELQKQKLFEDANDVQSQLYDGFIDDEHDKAVMSRIHELDLAQVDGENISFNDPRLEAMLPLYLARNYPGTLSDNARNAWESYKKSKLMGGGEDSLLSNYFRKLEELSKRDNLSANDRFILEELFLYGQNLIQEP